MNKVYILIGIFLAGVVLFAPSVGITLIAAFFLFLDLVFWLSYSADKNSEETNFVEVDEETINTINIGEEEKKEAEVTKEKDWRAIVLTILIILIAVAIVSGKAGEPAKRPAGDGVGVTATVVPETTTPVAPAPPSSESWDTIWRVFPYVVLALLSLGILGLVLYKIYKGLASERLVQGAEGDIRTMLWGFIVTVDPNSVATITNRMTNRMRSASGMFLVRPYEVVSYIFPFGEVFGGNFTMEDQMSYEEDLPSEVSVRGSFFFNVHRPVEFAVLVSVPEGGRGPTIKFISSFLSPLVRSAIASALSDRSVNSLNVSELAFATERSFWERNPQLVDLISLRVVIDGVNRPEGIETLAVEGQSLKTAIKASGLTPEQYALVTASEQGLIQALLADFIAQSLKKGKNS